MIFLGLIFLSPLKVIAAKEPVMRVLIAKENTASFRADSNKFIFVKGLSSQKIKTNSIKLILNNGQAKYSIDKKKQTWSPLPNNFILTIKNNHSRGIWFKRRRYAGELKVSLNNNKLEIINHLKLEKYLKSVVGSEMPKEFPLSALQAQAIAARTYALKLIGKNKLYDVHSTQANQVYLGLEAETAKTNRAVRSTNSLALFYENKLINAVFHSSSGGRTEDSGKVWKYQLPYLRSVIDYDQNSEKYRWSTKFTSKELKIIFPQLGDINGLQVVEKSNTNRVIEVIIYGSDKVKTISGKDLRTKLKLLSTKFEPVLKFNQPYKEHNHRDFKVKSNSILNEKNSNLAPYPFPEIPNDYFLLVEGFGAGHGVGMSQWGAKRMAEMGASFNQILKHYYSGVQIKTY
tara:strand:+ start:1091 stop:2296 length:1206 start_codon:yes stop_codon:yes gene_type:complete